MRGLRLVVCSLLVMGAWAILIPLHGSARAPGVVITGTASRDATKASFASGLGWWDASKSTLTVGFVSYAMNPAEEKKVLDAHSFFLGLQQKKPYLELNLVFKPGATQASLSTLERYYLVYQNFHFTKFANGMVANDPMSINRQYSDWSFCEDRNALRGRLGSGEVRGTHSGTYLFGMGSQKKVTYRWNLSFRVRQ